MWSLVQLYEATQGIKLDLASGRCCQHDWGNNVITIFYTLFQLLQYGLALKACQTDRLTFALMADPSTTQPKRTPTDEFGPRLDRLVMLMTQSLNSLTYFLFVLLSRN